MQNEPELSILIPIKDRLKLTSQCLDSLFATMPAHLCTEVIVQDNGSRDGTADYLASLSGRVRVVKGTAGCSYAQSNNAMARSANGRVLCLLNNDTVLLDGWIEPMLAVLDRHDDACMVGNVQLFPGEKGTRRINHAGVVFDDRRMPTHLYEGMPENLEASGAVRELQAVTAACVMIRRDRYQQLGGLDESYRNGHEDIDLCLRARAAGLKNWVVGTSRIVHFGSSTPGRLDHDDQNTKLFMSRHREAISADLGQVTHADGVAWPSRSRAYRMARALWKCRPIRAVLKRILRTSIGMRLRQTMVRRLSRSG